MRSNRPPLRSGVGPRQANSNQDVELIQTAFIFVKNRISRPYYNGRIDGRFGDKTLAAVLAFQSDNRLKCDGLVTNSSNCLRLIAQQIDR